MSSRTRLFLALALTLSLPIAPPAAGQVLGAPALPGVGLPTGPGLPQVRDLPLGAVDRLAGDTETLAARSLTDLRRTAARALVREHRDLIDVDPAGEPIVRGVVVALSPSPASLAAARQAGFEAAEDTRLDELGLRLVTLKVPRGRNARDAVRRLRELDPAGRYDFDHLYLGAGPARGAQSLAIQAGSPGGGPRIGLIDGAVGEHPSLAAAITEQRPFAPGGLKVSAHATAVASLIAGQAGPFRGAAPGARLLVADVYGPSPVGGSAVLIVKALAWLAQARVPVIEISLVGPPNTILQAAVDAVTARGVLLVAAVGNDGPAAPPLYPASYPGVVSVTGVDARRRVLPEAGRRTHVDFAAPGADMAAAAPGGGYVAVRGTSYAAPLVAGRLALGLQAPDPQAARAALARLTRDATDLGAPGPDPIFGQGLVAFDLRTPPAAVKAGRPR